MEAVNGDEEAEEQAKDEGGRSEGSESVTSGKEEEVEGAG